MAGTIKIISVDMDEELQAFAMTAVAQAFESNKLERDIAHAIKKSFDDQHQPVWNCAVGRDFGSHVVHQTKKYIFLSYHNSVYILIWKSN